MAFPDFLKITNLYAEISRDVAWFMLFLGLVVAENGGASNILEAVVYGL